ncbi:MAG: 2-oxoacid:ferredoxin oxidoreductase subunit beta, partial [Burkholderiales bacterium]|nr:2-oxoacid:ferredoxin oxidoreductase subunit beta [Burkholderiales bacterium]
FNSVHGRMPSVLTGANLANRDLIYLGISGDGDSASIGLGQFAHIMRRGVNMTYIVENNGVYGLTKGQFSATADKGSKSKAGYSNEDEPIDLVMLAVTLGATFVARGFSGDKGQLVPLIKAAVQHKGAAIVDVVSPCVAFNNHPGSTKSYDYVRAHNDTVNFLDYMPEREPIVARSEPGGVQTVVLHDGGAIRVRRVDESYDPTDKVSAMAYLEARREAGEVVTGLLFVNECDADLHDAQNTVGVPLNALSDAELVPGSAALAKVNASLR